MRERPRRSAGLPVPPPSSQRTETPDRREPGAIAVAAVVVTWRGASAASQASAIPSEARLSSKASPVSRAGPGSIGSNRSFDAVDAVGVGKAISTRSPNRFSSAATSGRASSRGTIGSIRGVLATGSDRASTDGEKAQSTRATTACDRRMAGGAAGARTSLVRRSTVSSHSAMQAISRVATLPGRENSREIGSPDDRALRFSCGLRRTTTGAGAMSTASAKRFNASPGSDPRSSATMGSNLGVIDANGSRVKSYPVHRGQASQTASWCAVHA